MPTKEEEGMPKVASRYTDSFHSSPEKPPYPCCNDFHPTTSPGVISRNKSCFCLHRTLAGSISTLPPVRSSLSGENWTFLTEGGTLHVPYYLQKVMDLLKVPFLLIQAPCGHEGPEYAAQHDAPHSYQTSFKRASVVVGTVQLHCCEAPPGPISPTGNHFGCLRVALCCAK